MLPRKPIFSDEGGEGDQVFGVLFRVARLHVSIYATNGGRQQMEEADRSRSCSGSPEHEVMALHNRSW